MIKDEKDKSHIMIIFEKKESHDMFWIFLVDWLGEKGARLIHRLLFFSFFF